MERGHDGVAAVRVHGHRGGVWWANPLVPVLFFIVPLVVMTWALPEHVYFAQWKTPKYFGFQALVVHLAAMLVFCIGALVATRGRLGLAAHNEWPVLSPQAWETLRSSFFWLYRLAIAAYVIWLGGAVSRGFRPTSLIDTLRTQNNYNGTLKAQFATVAGVTTLTQLGITAAVVGALLAGQRDRAVNRRVGVLVALAVARGFFLTERLAIIEVVLPYFVVRSAQMAMTRRQPAKRLLVRLAPVIAIPGLLLVFSLFEYSRSWTYLKTRTDDSFLVFSSYRLAGYYATSLNNGEVLRTTTDRSDRLPWYTVQSLWEMPGISSVISYEKVTGHEPQAPILAVKTNPEFNSPGGLPGPFIDYGNFGGLVYYLLLGVGFGALYRQFAGSRLLGLLLYPTMFSGLLELPRYMYWAQGRVMPSFIAAFVVSGVVAARARREVMHRRAVYA